VADRRSTHLVPQAVIGQEPVDRRGQLVQVVDQQAGPAVDDRLAQPTR
jgi:hypothetical protein